MIRRQRGFTYIELVIVAAIMGIVVGMGIPRATVAFEEARVDEAVSALGSIWHGQRMHWLEQGAYADTLDDLAFLAGLSEI